MNGRFRPLLTVVATLTLCGLPVRLQARSIPVPARYAQERAVTVKVWPGFGINISFLPARASIVKVWLDDPSKVVLDFDEPLCLAAEQANCESGRPSIIHLRRIQGLTFPHLPSADSIALRICVRTYIVKSKECICLLPTAMTCALKQLMPSNEESPKQR